MGLRSFFQRSPARAEVSRPAAAVQIASVEREPLSPEQLAELHEAWVELTEAARGSRVTSFRACTRAGRPWTEDPAAVRAVAATLREFPASDNQ
jgi:tRNA U34 5-methylaminomethyl-2-thiouridine-forming methyltransferase MnmC